jgi:predicted AlkP superfamily pyrophosphatase or phosphodiesterase
MALNRTAIVNIVGLTPRLLGSSTPRLSAWAARGATANIRGLIPAVTCSVQATYLTGQYPSTHGIVGNGWYFRDDCEVKFWRQSNKLVQAPKIWETARQGDPAFTCANLFWWYNMYSTADYSVTPRPMYPADGRKFPDIYTHPASLRTELQADLGAFPLFEFWGPRTSIRSSRWIAESAKRVETKFHPSLSLVYLPHLDYNLQRLGTADARIAVDLKEIDDVAGDLIDFYETNGVDVTVVSEYGIADVSRPVHLNRALRRAGLLAVREELGLEILDPGASAAFAVADHQVAHVYVNDPAHMGRVREILEGVQGVERVLDEAGKREYRIDHPRAGEFVVIAEPGAWFTYYYWLDDRLAPDFARTVDIHRKPGYDPAELFVDPAIPLPQAKAAWILLRKQLGFRYLMDLIPLDAGLVKGSHGRIADAPDCPLLITRRKELLSGDTIDADGVYGLILRQLGIAS